MRVIFVLAILAASLALGGCSHPNQAAYAKPRPTPLPHLTEANSVKPRVLRAKTARKTGSPIRPPSQATSSMKPPAPPARKSQEPRPVPSSASPSASAVPSATAKHYLVLDPVGNCSVIDSKSTTGLKIVGDKGGYASAESANRAMKDEAQCKGVVGTGAVDQGAEVKFKAAEAKAKKAGGVHKLTQEDIEGLSYEQIKQLRGY